MRRLFCAVGFLLAAFASEGASARIVIPVNNTPFSDLMGGFTVTEYGKTGTSVTIQPSGSPSPGTPDGPIGPPQTAPIVAGFPGDPYGSVHFTVDNSYTYQAPGGGTGLAQVTDYQQQFGDPSILSAAAFKGGAAVPLGNWLASKGYTSANPIIQPDFTSTDGSQIYLAYDLAKLGALGSAFSSAHSFGDILTIGANDSVTGLPGDVFSSTDPVLSGGGWQITPLSPGTDVEYVAFHATGAVPEPSTWALMLIGFSGLGFFACRGTRKSRIANNAA